jgi:hypothetical protein
MILAAIACRIEATDMQANKLHNNQPDPIDEALSAFGDTISEADLHKILRYDQDTGLLYWLPRCRYMFNSDRTLKSWNSKYAGKPALCCPSHGYMYGRIFGKSFFAHRVAWAMSYGFWPIVVDHINGNKADNRIANLRDTDTKGNSRNSKQSAINKSGQTGVFWFSRNAKWQSGIKVDGRYIYLGLFNDFNEAVAARKEAETKYGFHQNHGRIA